MQSRSLKLTSGFFSTWNTDKDLIREATKRPLEGAASVSVPTTDGVSDDSELVKYFLSKFPHAVTDLLVILYYKQLTSLNLQVHPWVWSKLENSNPWMLTCDMLVDHGDIPRQKLHGLNLMGIFSTGFANGCLRSVEGMVEWNGGIE